MDNLTYQQVLAAIEAGAGDKPTYARRPVTDPGWTDSTIYIGWDGTNVILYPAGTVYAPTTADEQATDWYDGPDKPPKP